MIGRKTTAIAMAFTVAAIVTICIALGISSGRVSEVREKDYDGVAYTGGLLGGRFDGKGLARFGGGERYYGGFADGRFDGQGVFSSSERWDFDGTFEDGQILGGIFRDVGGETILYARGETTDTLIGRSWQYEGALGESGQNGEGVFMFADGSTYSGRFFQGLADGEGTYTDASGNVVYEGGFKNGQFDGEGRYYSPEGWVYEGGFADGLFDGDGTILTEDADVIRGVWERGVQVTRYE